MCDYCSEDRDGYVTMLPREGTGRAFIHGDELLVNGPYKTRFSININYCPICGRKIKEETND